MEATILNGKLVIVVGGKCVKLWFEVQGRVKGVIGKEDVEVMARPLPYSRRRWEPGLSMRPTLLSSNLKTKSQLRQNKRWRRLLRKRRPVMTKYLRRPRNGLRIPYTQEPKTQSTFGWPKPTSL